MKMKLFSFMPLLLFLLPYFLQVYTSSTTRSRNWRLKTPHLQCNGTAIQLTPTFSASFEACREKMYRQFLPSTPIPIPGKSSERLLLTKDKYQSKKMRLCLLVCHLQDLELVDESGELMQESIVKLLKDHLPEPEANEIIKKGKECIKEFGSTIQIHDENCSSSEKLFHCAAKAFEVVCHSRMNNSITTTAMTHKDKH